MKPEAFFLEKPIFTTRDFASATDISLSAGSRYLKAWSKSGLVEKVTRGIWANIKHPNFTRFALVPYLLEKEQGYISFFSALERRGVISQIASSIHIASTGYSRKLECSLGTFEFIKVKPDLMCQGIEWFSAKSSYGLATAEKALLDCLYISTRKGNRFQNFPELDLSNLNQRRFFSLANAHPFPSSIRIAIETKARSLFARGVLAKIS